MSLIKLTKVLALVAALLNAVAAGVRLNRIITEEVTAAVERHAHGVTAPACEPPEGDPFRATIRRHGDRIVREFGEMKPSRVERD